MKKNYPVYYNLAEGWLVRREWSDYMIFHSKTRAMVRFNQAVYDIMHSLVGRTIKQSLDFLKEKKYVISEKEKKWVKKTAETLVSQKLLDTASQKIHATKENMDAITAPAVMDLSMSVRNPAYNYYQTPASVLWSVTNRCNFRCRYCAPESGPASREELLSEDLVNIGNELIKNRVFEIILTGGEALLRKKEVFGLLERFRRKNHFVHLLSNGLLIDDDIADRLTDLKIGIGISLDGPNDKINGSSRTPNTFEPVSKALRLLVKKGVWTNVLTVLNKFNIDALDGHFALLDSIGIKYLVLQPLRPVGRAQKIFESLRPTQEQLKRLPENLDKLKKRFPGINVDDYEVRSWGDLLRVKELPGREPRKLLSCGAGVRFCVIDALGEIAPCNALLDIPCGNLGRQSLPEIWHNSIPLRELRVLASKSVRAIAACRNCKLSELCDGGCRADAFHATGSWIGLHPYCLHPSGRELCGRNKKDDRRDTKQGAEPFIKEETEGRNLGFTVSH